MSHLNRSSAVLLNAAIDFGRTSPAYPGDVALKWRNETCYCVDAVLGKSGVPKLSKAEKGNSMLAFAVLIGSLGGPGEIPEVENQLINVPESVREVMDDAYGDTYSFKSACWATVFEDENGEHTEYCMRPGAPTILETSTGKTLYFHAFSATDVRDDPHYSYSHVQPGLMGAFKVQLDDSNGWTYDAHHGAMDYGTGGDCGCSEAKLVKLDNSGKHGWIFASGGTWQGVTVANFSIVTEIDGKMTDVSQIPEVREGAQDVRYEVSVKADPSADGMLPLHVVARKNEAVADEFDIEFDREKSIYAMPRER